MTRVKLIVIGALAVSLGLAGCSKKEVPSAKKTSQNPTAGETTEVESTSASGGGEPGTAAFSVDLLPPEPKVNDGLQALVRGGAGSPTFRWERNGETIPGQENDGLAPFNARRGDEVRVIASAGGVEASASVVLVNSPPEVVSLPLKTPYIHRGVDIEVMPEGADNDGDPVSFRYRWFINGERLEDADGPVLAGDRFRRGDRIGLQVVPFDGVQEGAPFGGQELVIPDAPPRFVTTPPHQFRASTYSYDARADDPDGDQLTYALESGPEGMNIDPSSGELRWDIGKAQGGEHLVRIAARDEEGMKDVQEYAVTISIPDQEKP